MVYCTKCGTLNPEVATNCSNCGSPLYVDCRVNYRHVHRHYQGDYHYHHQGGGIGLLIAGLIIVFLGLAALTGTLGLFWAYFWPLVLVVIGIWLLIWGLRRNRKYSMSAPQ
ncbi:MAG: zinc-ribbon domain-containing protein [Candidatus Bathyarchaeota archaeon]|nr:zinc-ribbon domain-containing protein [Candidatus Bathyarchaeota archaeon]